MSVWTRWVALWDRREAPQALALLRILVGAVLLADLLAAASCSAVSLLWQAPPLGAGRTLPLLDAALGGQGRTGGVLWSCAVALSALVMLGVTYRLTSWFLVLAMIALMHCQPAGDGIDALLRIVLPILAMSSAAEVWSFDAWHRARRAKPLQPTVPAWPRYLIVAQLLWVYFSAAQHRNSSWWLQSGFAAVGNVLSDPHFARFAPGALHAWSPLMRVGTFFTMLFELSAPLYLWLTWLDRDAARGGRLGALVRRWRVRWCWLALGVSLHLGIALTMRIGIFPFAILALYPAFLHPEEIAALRTRLRGAARAD